MRITGRSERWENGEVTYGAGKGGRWKTGCKNWESAGDDRWQYGRGNNLECGRGDIWKFVEVKNWKLWEMQHVSLRR
jgi:hypothetical protein